MSEENISKSKFIQYLYLIQYTTKYSTHIAYIWFMSRPCKYLRELFVNEIISLSYQNDRFIPRQIGSCSTQFQSELINLINANVNIVWNTISICSANVFHTFTPRLMYISNVYIQSYNLSMIQNLSMSSKSAAKFNFIVCMQTLDFTDIAMVSLMPKIACWPTL